MADRRVIPEQYLVDGTTPSQRAAVDASGRVSVSLTASSATVTVDSELPAAAALADGASNPTTPTVGAAGLTWNGATWDRVKSAATGQDSTGTGIQAVGIQAQLDDTSTTTVTENQFANLRMSSRRALLVEGVASGTNINVNLAASAATVTVDSELPAAAALADNTANPTVPGVGGFNMVFDGTNWDRQPGNSASGVFVQGDVAHDAPVTPANPLLVGGRASAAAPTDVSTDGDAVRAWYLRNGAQTMVVTAAGALIGGDATNGLDVDVTRVTGTVTVDSELPAAAALADATANPTVPGVGAFLMGYNGTTWDRVRTANTGRLQVDVVSGGSADTPTNPVTVTTTSASLAAGGSTTTQLRTSDLGGSTKKLTKVVAWSSAPFKADLQTVANGSGTSILVEGGQAGSPCVMEPPGQRTGRNYWSVAHPANAGFDGWQVIMTNLDGSEAADVYCTFYYED